MTNESVLRVFVSLSLPLFMCVAPSAVQNLMAVAEDSVSILVRWRSPAQPNGPIIQYRLQVLVADMLLQDITLTAEVVNQINTSHPSTVLKRLGQIRLDQSLQCILNNICILKNSAPVKFEIQRYRLNSYIYNGPCLKG